MRSISFSLLIVLSFIACDGEPEVLLQKTSSQDSGIKFINKITETDSFNILTEEYIFNGGGVAIADFDNNGTSDIFFTGNQVANKLYLNNGDFKFEDVSEKAKIEAEKKWSTGVSVTDINADGWPDLYVCAAMHQDSSRRKNMLFINLGLNREGIPVFEEKAAEYGIDDPKNSMNATFLDYDKDGHLDLYVLNNEQVHTLPTNYRPKIDDGSAVSNDRLYRNNGDGTFSDVTKEAGIRHEGFGLGLAVADFNYDGWPDIHVSNDYITNDLLYINNGDGTFSNNIRDVLKHQSKFSMGSDVSDYNNDGYLDLITLDMLGETSFRMKTTISDSKYINYVLNDRYDYEYQYMRNMLHKGNGPDLPASEIGQLAGVSKTDWSWSPLFADMDNDGYRDLLITNGFPRDITDMDFANYKLEVSRFIGPEKILDSIPVVKIANYAYRNKGNLTFEDTSTDWGIDIPSFSNGAAFADLDSDGDLDYVVNNINEEAFVFENNVNERPEKNNYLRIRLTGPKNNSQGIGAKVVLRYGAGLLQFQEQYLTRGYLSSVESTIHFGLGKNNLLDTLEILWPDGKFQRLTEVPVNRTQDLRYQDAQMTKVSPLSFPLESKQNETLFAEMSNASGVSYVHLEQDKVDYNVQRVLPHKLTQNGPQLAVGDINRDGCEDFIIGSSAGYSPMIFTQDIRGMFSSSPLFNDEDDLAFEEEDLILFDLEGDGDLDLYLVSGSNEFDTKSDRYIDRLLTNDGNGNFTPAPDAMPQVNASGSTVKVADFDGDGYPDLFVGGRTPPGQYPLAENSFVLKNEKGTLKDVTVELAPELKEIGMVTDAEWLDYNGDGLVDLIVVGELMPISIFKNTGSGFIKLHKTGLEDHLGWWECIASADMDGDGDMDFVVGNLGSNNFFQPSEKRPVTVVAKDFDSNGSIDPITFSYFKTPTGEYESSPVHLWGDINNQSRLFRDKFNLYSQYAQATENTLLDATEKQDAVVRKGNYDKSTYIENLGEGTFRAQSLPIEAQVAPLNDLVVEDIDGDGHIDILGVGNDFGNETFIGRYDALNGIFLKGDGNGNFTAVGTDASGFKVTGDAKAIERLKSVKGTSLYLATQNRGPLLIFRYTGKKLVENGGRLLVFK